jgi:uncharacterized protein (TIGR00730 family)
MSAAGAREARTPDEELLAADLPSVRADLDDGQRTARATEELENGFRSLADLGRAVSLFGSARIPEDHPEYALARETARRLGEAGCAIITGGGPGIMEAGNRGARDAGVTSVGLNIVLPFEQAPNPYQDIGLMFDFFFTRKVMFVRYSSAFVVFPGGFGTLDELFEALVLIQTEKIEDFPVVLVGTAFWGGLVDWLRERVAADGMISPGDLDRFTVTDDVDAVVAAVERGCAQQWATV